MASFLATPPGSSAWAQDRDPAENPRSTGELNGRAPIGNPPPFPAGAQPGHHGGERNGNKEDDDSDDQQPPAPTPSNVGASMSGTLHLAAYLGTFLGTVFAQTILRRTGGGLADLFNLRTNRAEYEELAAALRRSRGRVSKGLDNVEHNYNIYKKEFAALDAHIDKLLEENRSPLTTLLREADEHADAILELPILKRADRKKQRDIVEAAVRDWKTNRDFRALNEWVLAHLDYDAMKKGAGPAWMDGYLQLQQAIAARYWKDHRSTEKLDAWIEFGKTHGTFDRNPLKAWLYGEPAKGTSEAKRGYEAMRVAEHQLAQNLVKSVATVKAEASKDVPDPRAYPTLKVRDDRARDPGEFHYSSQSGDVIAKKHEIESETRRQCKVHLSALTNATTAAQRKASLSSALFRATVPSVPVAIASVATVRKLVHWMESMQGQPADQRPKTP